MDEREKRNPDSTEGVRIIGAQEAAEALERGDVAKRRPDDVPRYGDRPAPPPEHGPRPAIRFPLGATDPADVDRPAVVPPDPVIRPSGDASMPHWTEPATGEVPRIFASDDDADEDLDAWSAFSSSAPRWRGEGSEFEAAHDFDDLSRLGDDETRVGALDSRDRPHPNDFFAFDDAADEPEPVFEPAPRAISTDPRRARRTGPVPGLGTVVGSDGSGRDLQAAVAVGVGIGVLALILFKLGPKFSMALVTAVIVLAAAEFYNGVRKAGFQPATLLGIAATASIVLASYWKGDVAPPLVLFLTVVFGMLWYLLGVSHDRPVLNLGITLTGVLYVGFLGSYAALLLRSPDGVGLLLGAVVPTVGYDVGGLFVGRNAGTRPITAISPNKTVEGTLGGIVVAVIAAVVLAGAFKVDPWTTLGDGLWLGFVVAGAALLGDLCESLIKRDLGVKDMGDVLPGHGGLLDRFDGMLFALPATYYLALIILK